MNRLSGIQDSAFCFKSPRGHYIQEYDRTDRCNLTSYPYPVQNRLGQVMKRDEGFGYVRHPAKSLQILDRGEICYERWVG